MSNEFETISLPNLGAALWNNRFKALITFLLILGAATAYYLVAPRKYASEAKLFVQLGRGSIGVDPSATTSGTISLNESRETEINSIVELMRSRELAAKVADEVGVDRILETDLELSNWGIVDWLKSLADREDVQADMPLIEYESARRREEAIETLMDNVQIDAGKKTTVVYVWATAQSPKLAQDIAGSYVSLFQGQYVEINKTDRSYAFFDEHFNETKTKVANAEKELSDFRNKHGILSIEGARNLLQSKIDSLQMAILEAESQLDASEARLSEYTTQLAAMEKTVQLRSTNVADTATDLMRDRLSQLEVERTTLSAKLPPGHPKLVAIEDAISKVRQMYSEMSTGRDESTMEVNPNYIAVDEARMIEKSSLSGMKKLHEALNRRLAETRLELEDMNGKELIAMQLQRNINVLQSELQSYSEGRAQASQRDQLDADSISNVKPSQEAHLMLKHVSPRGSIVLLLGGIFALISSFIVALLAEMRTLKVIDPREIEERLDLPILVDIPRVAPSQAVLSS